VTLCEREGERGVKERERCIETAKHFEKSRHSFLNPSPLQANAVSFSLTLKRTK